MQIGRDSIITNPQDDEINRFFKLILDSLPPLRKKRDIVQIHDHLTESRTRQILDNNPSRFITQIDSHDAFLDTSMITRIDIQLQLLKDKYSSTERKPSNTQVAEYIKEFLKILDDENYFLKMPFLLQGIQALSKGKLMHNFLNATSLKLAIRDLNEQLSSKTEQTLSVKRTYDLFNLPVSFIKTEHTYHALINIPITHTNSVPTYQLIKHSYIFLRNGQPYYITIKPDYDIIAPPYGLHKYFVFKHSDLVKCILIRKRRFCPLTFAQPSSIHKCLIAIYDNKPFEIIKYCPISISKIREVKTIPQGNNEYNTISTTKQNYDITCNDNKPKFTDKQPNIIYQFTLTQNCSQITSKHLHLFNDATDIIKTYMLRDLTLTDIIDTVFKNYPLDISELFSIANTRSLDSLLDNPYHFSNEEKLNIAIGIAISSLLTIILFIIQYLLYSRCNIRLKIRNSDTCIKFKRKTSNAYELSDKPDHTEITQRFQNEFIPNYAPSYITDAQAPDYPLDLSKAPDYPIN